MRFPRVHILIAAIGLILVFDLLASGQGSSSNATGNSDVQHHRSAELQLVLKELEQLRSELRVMNDANATPWKVYGIPLSTVGAGLITAVGGWFVTYLILKKNFDEQKRVRQDEWKKRDQEREEAFLIEALQNFGGGTQTRSVGIALVEAYWQNRKDLQPVWNAVLTNQAVYILSKVKKGDLAAHERSNLERIFQLLRQVPGLRPDQLEQLRESLGEIGAEKGPLADRISEWTSWIRGMRRDPVTKDV